MLGSIPFSIASEGRYRLDSDFPSYFHRIWSRTRLKIKSELRHIAHVCPRFELDRPRFFGLDEIMPTVLLLLWHHRNHHKKYVRHKLSLARL